MAEKDYLRPIVNSLGKFVPTNRALLKFINSKARGTGIDLSFHKVKFLNKSEKSTYTCMNVELMEFRKYLGESGVSEEETNRLIGEATQILEDGKKQVEKVYDDVRRYIITSEIRTFCLEKYYKRIPSLNKRQNDAIAKEIFTLAYEENREGGEERDISDVILGFRRINKIAVGLFALAESEK